MIQYYSLVFQRCNVNLGSFYLFLNEFQRDLPKKINLALVKLHVKNNEFYLYSKEPKFILKILKNQKVNRNFLLLMNYLMYFEWNLSKNQVIVNISKQPEIIPMVVNFVETFNRLTPEIFNTEIDLKSILAKKQVNF